MIIRDLLLEVDPVEGVKVGRDVRKMKPEELEFVGLERISRGDAVRAKCLDCCAGSPSEVRRCVAVECPLWPFRFGSDPFREKREMNDEQREAARVRLQNARNRIGEQS